MSGPDADDAHSVACPSIVTLFGDDAAGLGCAWMEGDGTVTVRDDVRAVLRTPPRRSAHGGYASSRGVRQGSTRPWASTKRNAPPTAAPITRRWSPSRLAELTPLVRAEVSRVDQSRLSLRDYRALAAQADAIRAELPRTWPSGQSCSCRSARCRRSCPAPRSSTRSSRRRRGRRSKRAAERSACAGSGGGGAVRDFPRRVARGRADGWTPLSRRGGAGGRRGLLEAEFGRWRARSAGWPA